MIVCVWNIIISFYCISESDATSLDRIILDVPTDTFEVSQDAQGYAEFLGSQVQWLQQTGEPALPWRVITVLLPPQADLETVTVRLVGGCYRQLEGKWQVKPMPPEMTWHAGQKLVYWPHNRIFVDGYDQGCYAQDRLWPEAEARVLSTGRMRKFRLARIGFPLFRYNPRQGSLVQFGAGRLEVRFHTAPLSGDASILAELNDRIGTETIRRLAINHSEGLQAYEQTRAALTRKTGYSSEAKHIRSKQGNGYVIITTSAIQSGSTELVNFINYKQTQGYTVTVITESEFGGGSGDTAAENIRTWLQAHYISDSIEYVLLIGDSNTSTGDIPMKLTYPRVEAPLYWTPTDYYYVDLTGDWDLDNDSVYGEYNDDFGTGGVDRNWDVLVGRIPYYGVMTDLDAILQRLITYESQPPENIGWRTNALLAMAYIDEYVESYRLGEDIKDDILTDAGWSYYRIYDNPPVLDPPPESSVCTNPICVGAWSSNPFGLVVYSTHGSATSAADVISTSDVPSLNDTYPSFVFQAACMNACPENTGNLAYTLVQHGALNTIGGTRDVWSLQGHYVKGYATIEGMAYEYAARIIPSGLSSGLALSELKQMIEPNYYSGGLWMNYCATVIYGDPSMTLYVPELRVHNLTQNTWYATIKRAVDVAVSGDEIVLNQGTYRGIDNKDIDFNGKALTVRSADPDNPQVVANTVIDLGQTNDYGFIFQAGEGGDAVVSGLTIINGGTLSSAITCQTGSSPTISKCQFKYCLKSPIYLSSSSAIIEDCLFSDNTSTQGAGMYIGNGNPQVIGCSFTANNADQGGAIYLLGSGAAEIRDCLIFGNSATTRGGGIADNYSDLPLINCIITGNYTLQYGGAISVGLFNQVRLINSTISANRADLFGGGLYLLGADALFDNCIVSENTAPTGSGMYLDDHIVQAPTATIATSDVVGGAASVEVENGNCVVTWDACIDADPLFVEAGSWDENGTPGDPTDDIWSQGDYHLTASSPCLEAGNNSVTDLPSTDFEGDPRIIDYDGDMIAQVDIGADEAVVPPELLILSKGDAESDGIDDILLEWSLTTTDLFNITYTTSLSLVFEPLFTEVTLPVYHIDALTDGNNYYYLAERATP